MTPCKTPWNPALRCGLAAFCLVLLCGCHLTALHSSKPTFNEDSFKAHPPRSIAVLPTTDDSGHPELKPLVRRELSAAVAPLPYEDREIRRVDEFLATKAAGLGVAPDKMTTEQMTDAKLADCVIFSRIERVSRFYLVLYAHYRFDLDLSMVDTRTRQVVYRNHFIFYDRLGSPAFVAMPILNPLALAPVATSSVESLWHLRSSRLAETFEEGSKEIAKSLPVPEMLEMSDNGALRLTSIQVTKPFDTLGPGERVIVKAQATPGSTVTLSIGKIARDIPMKETTAGSYFGIYTVKPGDNADYAIAELHLAKGGEQVDFAYDKEPFAIDTAPPPRARVSWAGHKLLRTGIYMKFELDPQQAAQKDKSLEYHVYKKLADGKYDRIGISKRPAWHDADARPGQTEEYYVITKDGAGNLSPLWEVKQVKVE